MSTDAKVALSPAEFRALTVTSIETVSHDSKKIVFALPTPEHEIGLTVASSLAVKAEIDGETVIRPYTPVNLNSDKGVLELVVKGYPNGKLSKHIVGLKVGDSLEFKGPCVKFAYKPNQYSRIGLIIGGTGIAPAFQVIKEVVRVAEDKTEVDLIFANNTEEDVLLHKELDAIAAKHSNVRVHYVVKDTSPEWTGHTGFVTPELVQKLLPSSTEDGAILIGVCGPPPMMEAVSGSKGPRGAQGELGGSQGARIHAGAGLQVLMINAIRVVAFLTAASPPIFVIFIRGRVQNRLRNGYTCGYVFQPVRCPIVDHFVTLSCTEPAGFRACCQPGRQPALWSNCVGTAEVVQAQPNSAPLLGRNMPDGRVPPKSKSSPLLSSS